MARRNNKSHQEPEAQQPVDATLIVGLGASAGGIEALKSFFTHLPESDGVAFVVIMHLAPEVESHLAKVLQQSTSLPVTQVKDRVRLEGRHVYVIPPGKNLLAQDGHLILEEIEEQRHSRAPVDHFFRTLADAWGERAVCVVLSGSGADGSVGILRIKEHGGLVLAQRPQEAGHEDMPRATIATGVVDKVLSTQKMGEEVAKYLQHLARLEDGRPLTGDSMQELQRIFIPLRNRTGHDFSHYKRPTVQRRVERRMHVRGVDTLDDYLELLQQQPDEAHALQNELLISVTNFFRDPEAFEVLEKKVIPQLFEDKLAQDEVRVWIAGCATGEEAYSIAMLLMEYAFNLDIPPAVQVFATDLSDKAIQKAREGRYPASIEADVSPERLQRFFRQEQNGYRIRQEVREKMLFARHGLLKDPPFSQIDLVSCRNVLIYLQPLLQEQLLSLFHYSLRPSGHLFLGTAESVAGANRLYRTVDKSARLYRRRNIETPLPTLQRSLTQAALLPDNAEPAPTSPLKDINFANLHRQLASDMAPPSVLINADYDIVFLSDSVSQFLRFAGGAPTQHLPKLVVPELLVELQTSLFEVRRKGHQVVSRPVTVTQGDDEKTDVRLRVRPIAEGDLVHVVFESAPPTAPVQQEGEADADAHTRSGYERELMETREQLHLIVEEYETSRSELKAQNEELQSINEELRSTAEELETSKEEAQSMAEELQTVNAELKQKVSEAMRAKSDVENLIVSSDIGTLFLDPELRIKRFTPHVRDNFHIVSSDIGRPLTDLAHRFGSDSLVPIIEAVSETFEPRDQEMTNDQGRCFLVRGRPYRTRSNHFEGVVLTFVDITNRKEAQAREQLLLQIDAERKRLEGILHNMPVGAVIVEPNGKLIYANEEMDRIFEQSFSEIASTTPYLQWPLYKHDSDELLPHAEKPVVLACETGERVEGKELRIKLPDGTWRYVSTNSAPIRDAEGDIVSCVTAFMDVTERYEAEQLLRETETRFRHMAETVPDVLFTATPEGLIDYVNTRMERVTGLPTDSLLGTYMWPDFIHPEDRADALTRWSSALDTQRSYEARYRLLTESGESCWHIARARPVYDESGALTRWFGTLTEVDALVQAQQEVQALNALLEARVAERTEQVRNLAASLTLAEQREHQRIAQILHDDLQQILYGLSISLGLLKKPVNEADKNQLLDRSLQTLEQAISTTRMLAVELSPPVLKSSELDQLLQWTALRVEDQYNLHVTVTLDGPCRIHRADLRVLLYQLLRELLFNIVKHAGTDKAVLHAWETENEVMISIEDNGVGFDLDTVKARRSLKGGLGLFSVGERLELIGGHFSIESVPGDGTRVVLAIPVEKPPPDSAPAQ